MFIACGKKCKTPKLSKVVKKTLKARKMKSRIPKKSTKAREMKTKHVFSIPTPLSSLALVFCTSFLCYKLMSPRFSAEGQVAALKPPEGGL